MVWSQLQSRKKKGTFESYIQLSCAPLLHLLFLFSDFVCLLFSLSFIYLFLIFLNDFVKMVVLHLHLPLSSILVLFPKISDHRAVCINKIFRHGLVFIAFGGSFGPFFIIFNFSPLFMCFFNTVYINKNKIIIIIIIIIISLNEIYQYTFRNGFGPRLDQNINTKRFNRK